MVDKAALLRSRFFENELQVTATRSSGPGGQHVNKVSTRVEVRFNLSSSSILSQEEKDLLQQKLANKITKEGDIIVVSQEERSQADNRERAIEKFYNLIARGLARPKKRRPTKPTVASRVRRMETKIHHARKKSLRKPEFDD
jgi:ribosome-associated protein